MFIEALTYMYDASNYPVEGIKPNPEECEVKPMMINTDHILTVIPEDADNTYIEFVNGNTALVRVKYEEINSALNPAGRQVLGDE